MTLSEFKLLRDWLDDRTQIIVRFHTANLTPEERERQYQALQECDKAFEERLVGTEPMVLQWKTPQGSPDAGL
jgi:hypothetical protein